MGFQAIAVIDLGISGLYIYDVPDEFNSEQIEDFISEQGHHLNNCDWGCFDGTIHDERPE